MSTYTLNKSLLSKIQALLEHICSFHNKHNLSLPLEIEFWCQFLMGQPRVGIFSPVGTDAAKIFNLIATVQLENTFFLTGIYETSSELPSKHVLLMDRSSSPDNKPYNFNIVAHKYRAVQVLPAPLNNLYQYTLVIFGAITAPEIVLPMEWVEYVSVAIIVSPANALLGKVEVDLIEYLGEKKRLPLLMVTGIDGDDEDDCAKCINEISKSSKVISLKNKIGDFPILYSMCNDEGSLQNTVLHAQNWLNKSIGNEMIRQVFNIGLACLSQAKIALDNRVLQNTSAIESLDYVLNHLDIQCKYFRNIVFHQITHVVNSLYEHLELTLNDCINLSEEFVSWMRKPSGNWNSFIIPLEKRFNLLQQKYSDIPQEMVNIINKEFNKFIKSYNRIPVFPFEEVTLNFDNYQNNLVKTILEPLLKDSIHLIEKDAFEKAYDINADFIPNKDIKKFIKNENLSFWKKTKNLVSHLVNLQEKSTIKDTIKDVFEVNLRPPIAEIKAILLSDVKNTIESSYGDVISKFTLFVKEQVHLKKQVLLEVEGYSELSELNMQWNELEPIFEMGSSQNDSE